MIWLYTVLGVTIGIWIVLGWYVFARIKENYRRNGVFTDKLLITWYVMWAFHHVPVVLASVWAVWSIPLNRTLALTAGSVVFLGGLVILPMGMLEFRSLRRSTGQDISRLITSGIYRWSRNPQFVGWFLMLLGISLAGRSGGLPWFLRSCSWPSFMGIRSGWRSLTSSACMERRTDDIDPLRQDTSEYRETLQDDLTRRWTLPQFRPVPRRRRGLALAGNHDVLTTKEDRSGR